MLKSEVVVVFCIGVEFRTTCVELSVVKGLRVLVNEIIVLIIARLVLVLTLGLVEVLVVALLSSRNAIIVGFLVLLVYTSVVPVLRLTRVHLGLELNSKRAISNYNQTYISLLDMHRMRLTL